MERVVIALILELLIAAPIIYTLGRLYAHHQNNFILEWTIQHFLYPLARILLILFFIFIAYPAIYNLDSLPGLTHILFGTTDRVHTLVNILFITSLLLPFLPIVGVIPALIIPIQSILATALIFKWAASESHEFTLIPNIWVLIAIIILSLVTHSIAKYFAEFLAKAFEKSINQHDMEKLAYESSLLAFQVPAILVYGFYLGSQISG